MIDFIGYHNLDQHQRSYIISTIMLSQMGTVRYTKAVKAITNMVMDWPYNPLGIKGVPDKFGIVARWKNPMNGEYSIHLQDFHSCAYEDGYWEYEDHSVNIKYIRMLRTGDQVVEKIKSLRDMAIEHVCDPNILLTNPIVATLEDLTDDEINQAIYYGKLMMQFDADELTALSTARNQKNLLKCVNHISLEFQWNLIEIIKILMEFGEKGSIIGNPISPDELQHIKERLEGYGKDIGIYAREFDKKLARFSQAERGELEDCGQPPTKPPVKTITAVTSKLIRIRKNPDTSIHIEDILTNILEEVELLPDRKRSVRLLSETKEMQDFREYFICASWLFRGLLAFLKYNSVTFVDRINTGNRGPQHPSERLEELISEEHQGFGEFKSEWFRQTSFDPNTIRNLIKPLKRLVEFIPAIPAKDSPVELQVFMREYHPGKNLEKLSAEAFQVALIKLIEHTGLKTKIVNDDNCFVDIFVKAASRIAVLNRYSSNGVLVRWIRKNVMTDDESSNAIMNFRTELESKNLNHGIIIQLFDVFESQLRNTRASLTQKLHIEIIGYGQLKRLVSQYSGESWYELFPFRVRERDDGNRIHAIETLLDCLKELQNHGKIGSITRVLMKSDTAVKQLVGVKTVNLIISECNNSLLHGIEEICSKSGNKLDKLIKRRKSTNFIKILDRLVVALNLPALEITKLKRIKQRLEIYWNPNRAVSVRLIKVVQHLLLNSEPYDQRRIPSLLDTKLKQTKWETITEYGSNLKHFVIDLVLALVVFLIAISIYGIVNVTDFASSVAKFSLYASGISFSYMMVQALRRNK